MIAAGHRRRMDVGRVNERWFLTTASLGLSVQITEELSSESKRRWGPFAYVVTAIRCSASPRLSRRDLLGGRTRQTRRVQIVVGNGRYYGAASPWRRDATIDDARLDLYSLGVQPLVGAAQAGARPQVGHPGCSGARWRRSRAKEFEIRTRQPMPIDVDGELGGRDARTVRSRTPRDRGLHA